MPFGIPLFGMSNNGLYYLECGNIDVGTFVAAWGANPAPIHGVASFGIGVASVVVPAPSVTANSVIQVSLASNDGAMTCARYLAGAGTFTVYADTPPAAAAKVVYSIFT